VILLVTGGLGYIGSHTCVALAQAGHGLAILDSLANSKLAVFAASPTRSTGTTR
jgi:UDP-glucose 4-epimerase